jgi:hypothetical protein
MKGRMKPSAYEVHTLTMPSSFDPLSGTKTVTSLPISGRVAERTRTYFPKRVSPK